MTQAEALDKLIAAVENGNANFDWGFATSPSRKTMPTQWHDAMNAYLGSLDAAKALHEALLPGWFPGLSRNIHHGHWYAWTQDKLTAYFSSEEPDPARALLLATLKAYRAGL